MSEQIYNGSIKKGVDYMKFNYKLVMLYVRVYTTIALLFLWGMGTFLYFKQ